MGMTISKTINIPMANWPTFSVISAGKIASETTQSSTNRQAKVSNPAATINVIVSGNFLSLLLSTAAVSELIICKINQCLEPFGNAI